MKELAERWCCELGRLPGFRVICVHRSWPAGFTLASPDPLPPNTSAAHSNFSFSVKPFLTPTPNTLQHSRASFPLLFLLFHTSHHLTNHTIWLTMLRLSLPARMQAPHPQEFLQLPAVCAHASPEPITILSTL